nr:MAG TPA: hypothetical protein [Caudoviricetes sp.]
MKAVSESDSRSVFCLTHLAFVLISPEIRQIVVGILPSSYYHRWKGM